MKIGTTLPGDSDAETGILLQSIPPSRNKVHVGMKIATLARNRVERCLEDTRNAQQRNPKIEVRYARPLGNEFVDAVAMFEQTQQRFLATDNRTSALSPEDASVPDELNGVAQPLLPME